MKRHRRRTMKDGPAEIYTEAVLRVRAAMNRGDVKEARHWTGIAERVHRMEFHYLDAVGREQRYELDAQERRLRIARLERAAKAPQYR